MTDIQWIENMASGLAQARNLSRPVVLMPVGQGMDCRDTWCPAASFTRANLSHPDVVSLIERAFVPVRFSMHISGPAVDDQAREFVVRQPASGPFDTYPPDLFVVSPEAEVLARVPYDATTDDILASLRGVLSRHAELAAPDALLEPTIEDPVELELRALEAHYQRNTPSREWWRRCVDVLFSEGGIPPRDIAAIQDPDPQKAELVPALESWLSRHAESHRDLAALARVLLGGARAHAGDYGGARAAWREVLELHPEHGLRHRAKYNLIEPGAFPSLPLVDIATAPRPSATEHGIVLPDEARRASNLALVRASERYRELLPGLPFVRIPAGSFTMGGSPAVQARELPNRRVTISKPFAMAAWPVTRALYARFRPKTYTPEELEGLAGELPAVHLSWLDATEFAEWASREFSRRVRLPTEAEWEYAARGGLESKPYPWGDEEPDETRCSYVNLHVVPVGCYPPNGYGLFDAVGNNFEWCADYYAKDAYARTAAEVVDPKGPSKEEAASYGHMGLAGRVARGGGWTGNEMCHINCRNSWRIGWPDGFRWCNLGVRLVIDED